MTKKSGSLYPVVSNLFVISTNEKEQAKLVALKQARLVAIKKVESKPKILLPPPQEKYIKARKHDFL